eukprot:COSAG06_NODE_8116_length_2269_cov_17.029032_3_plen_143_part_01
MRPPRLLHVLLLLLASSSRARAQQHPPGSGWPAGGAASPAIVSAPLGVSLQGNVESPGDNLWYSFEATANRERARPCTRSLCRLMPQPLGRFHVLIVPASCSSPRAHRPARADAYVVTTQLLDLSDSTLSLWEATSASGLDVA